MKLVLKTGGLKLPIFSLQGGTLSLWGHHSGSYACPDKNAETLFVNKYFA
jgi:hypothetical protein